MRATSLSAILTALLFVGVSCPTAGVPIEIAQTPPSASSGTATVGSADAVAPYYVAYSADAVAAARAEGRAVVLYFWASWCPICRADEPLIKTRIEGSGLPVAGFRVDFDAEKELKAQYRIPYQHTTVFLNAKGEETERFTGPVDDAAFAKALETAVDK